MSAHAPDFREPSRVERIFNKAFGLLVGLGLAPRYNYLVEVRGRSSGRVYAAPVNVLELGGRRFLVAPRGRTQWVRNSRGGGRGRAQARSEPAGSDARAFRDVADRYPVFELLPPSEAPSAR